MTILTVKYVTIPCLIVIADVHIVMNVMVVNVRCLMQLLEDKILLTTGEIFK